MAGGRRGGRNRVVTTLAIPRNSRHICLARPTQRRLHVPDVRGGRPLLPLPRTARKGATGGARRNHAGQCQLAVAVRRDGADRATARRTARAHASVAEVGIRLRYARMTELTSLTIADARDGLRNRAFSAAELTRAHLAAMEEARVL